MSFVYRNILSPAIATSAMAYSIYYKFDRVWGKEYIDEVYVYKKTLPFYTRYYRTDTVFKRFILSLGISFDELVAQPVDGDIESIYFYFKTGFVWDGTTRPPGTADPIDDFESTTGLIAPTYDELVTSINDTFVEDDIIEVTVSYGGDLKTYITEHELEWEATDLGIVSTGLNVETIRNVLHAQPWYYFGNCNHLDYTEDNIVPFQIYDGSYTLDTTTREELYAAPGTPVTRVAATVEGYNVTDYPIGEEPNYALGAFALMGDGTVFEPILDEFGNLEILDQQVTTAPTSRDDGEILEYSYKVRYKFKPIVRVSQLVQEMVAYYDTWVDISDNIKYTAEETIQSTTDTLIKTTLVGLLISEQTNSLYYRNQLRVESVDLMKKKDFVRLIRKLSTDYKVKEASWWEKIMAIVIVIIAIIIAVVTYGATTGSIYVAIGYAATAATITLTVGIMLLSSFGGLSTQGLVKRIGAFAQITGIIAMVAGFISIIQNMGTQYAVSEGGKAGLTAAEAGATDTAILAAYEAAVKTASEFTFQNVVGAVKYAAKQALASVVDKISGAASLDASSLVSITKDSIKVIDYTVKHLEDEEQAKFNAEYSAKGAELERYDEERFDNVLTDMAKTAMYMQDKASSYDALEELNSKIRREGPDGWFDKLEAHHNIV